MCTKLCKCFCCCYMQQEIMQTLKTLNINSLKPIIAKTVSLSNNCQVQCLVNQTLRFFWEYTFRCSRPELVYKKKGILKNFAKFIGQHLCWSLLFNKVANWRLVTLLKRDSSTSVALRILQSILEYLFCDTCKRLLFYIARLISTGKSLLERDLSLIHLNYYARSIKTKVLLLIRLQIQNEIRYNFRLLIIH